MKVIRYNAELHGEKLPPQEFDPAKSMEGFETFEQARKRRKLLITLLAEGGVEERKLSAKLVKCKSGARCLSGACPVCMRRVRRNWAGNYVIPAVLRDEAEWLLVTAIPDAQKRAAGLLHSFCPRRMNDALRKQLSRGILKKARVLGGIDFNFFENRKGYCYWQPHWHLLVQATHKQVHEALKKYYPRTCLTLKPFEAEAVDKAELLTVATYVFKSVYKLDLPRAFSFHRPFVGIEEKHWMELAPLLDKWSFSDRIFQKGFWS